MLAPCILEMFLSPLPSYLSRSLDDKRTSPLSCVLSFTFSNQSTSYEGEPATYIYMLAHAES